MRRRQFIGQMLKTLFLSATPSLTMSQTRHNSADHRVVTLFLCGDVMTGRGIDQILPHSVDPQLHESYVRDARRYVTLAEQASGPVPETVNFDYIWGDALDVFQRVSPDIRIINLETSVTTSDDYWPGKGIHYRMHPDNLPCLTAAGIDCCVLSNNHVLDWGDAGLEETLDTLHRAGLHTAGAGYDRKQAAAPAVMTLPGGGRLLVFGFAMESSGAYEIMAADEQSPGINLLEDFSERSVMHIRDSVRTHKRSGDIVVLSVHWGGNWGYAIANDQIEFSHRLIDEAGVDVIHGHSSHHVKAVEVYKDRPIFYGCGDLITDYEGIGGHEDYRGDLGLLYFVHINRESGALQGVRMVPTRMHRLQLRHPSEKDCQWLLDVLNREGRRFDTRVEIREDNSLWLQLPVPGD